MPPIKQENGSNDVPDVMSMYMTMMMIHWYIASSDGGHGST